MHPITDPTAFGDQYDAATTDAARTLAAIAAVLAAPITPGPPSAWLHGQISALQDALTRHEVYACPHLSAGPAVAFAAVWAPGILACGACARAILTPDPEEDQRCDQCRRPAPLLYPGLVHLGPILLTYGLCEACSPTTPTPPVPAIDGDHGARRSRPRSRPSTRTRADRKRRRRR